MDQREENKEMQIDTTQRDSDKLKREGQTGLGASARDTNVKTEEQLGLIEFIVVRNDK
jgi:hypothetical protein